MAPIVFWCHHSHGNFMMFPMIFAKVIGIILKIIMAESGLNPGYYIFP